MFDRALANSNYSAGKVTVLDGTDRFCLGLNTYGGKKIASPLFVRSA